MKKIKLYQILPLGMAGICVAGMCLVGVRIAARRVLIAKLGIENKITCTLGDYNWGDRSERNAVSEDDVSEAAPERLAELAEILHGASPASDGTTFGDDDAVQEVDADTDDSLLARYEERITTIEDDITKYCNEKFMFYRPMRAVAQFLDRAVSWDLAYARTAGTTYTLTTGFDYQAVEKEDCSAFSDALIEESEIAKEAGVPFLYVQYPYRVDEENSQVPWGATSEENANADAVLSALRGAGVDTLDLRDALVDAGWQYNAGFYDTDGHWTTRTGFTSASILAAYCNDAYEFSFDLSLFDEDRYQVESYSLNNYQVSEQVELFLPAFDTDLLVYDAYRSTYYEGAFTESCMDMTKVETTEYSTVLTAYSASRIRNSYLFEYQNQNATNNARRILIASDSFSWHIVPYLALDTDIVDYVYKMTPDQLSYYMDKLDPDLVIVLDRP